MEEEAEKNIILSKNDLIKSLDYSTKTREELIALCKEKKIKGYSSKKKEDILKLLSKQNDDKINENIQKKY